ncbi:MAG: hypothetical protein VXW63_00585 [Chloroflexota bacterium]|nr:hypothetical protein [Chloroflexota bacterium]MEC8712965.1 hypothetical protein [Chloroflexota bacterium]
MNSNFFSKFFKNDPIEKLWTLLSSIKFLKNENILNPRNKVGVMCWEKNDQIKVFCDKKLKNILNDGVEDSKTTFNLIDESGEVVWIILEDRDFNELVASAFTTVNALSQEINNESVMGLIFPVVIENTDNSNYLDHNQRHYLIFNENPPGYYPLVYQNEDRQPIAEIELFDLIKNSGIEFNKDQRKWFSVDNIPI